MRLGIVASRFNEEISGELLKRAKAEAKKLGVEFTVTSVPGALEIPVALQWLAQSGRYDALAAVGCVIRGETYHFEIVCNESARGVMDVALECGLPVANGILTTEDEAQAIARFDKGAEAVRVAVEMVSLKEKLQGKSGVPLAASPGKSRCRRFTPGSSPGGTPSKS
jgi:6,7-dimethyl-8-ribityllumazine synthase